MSDLRREVRDQGAALIEPRNYTSDPRGPGFGRAVSSIARGFDNALNARYSPRGPVENPHADRYAGTLATQALPYLEQQVMTFAAQEGADIPADPDATNIESRVQYLEDLKAQGHSHLFVQLQGLLWAAQDMTTGDPEQAAEKAAAYAQATGRSFFTDFNEVQKAVGEDARDQAKRFEDALEERRKNLGLPIGASAETILREDAFHSGIEMEYQKTQAVLQAAQQRRDFLQTESDISLIPLRTEEETVRLSESVQSTLATRAMRASGGMLFSQAQQAFGRFLQVDVANMTPAERRAELDNFKLSTAQFIAEEAQKIGVGVDEFTRNNPYLNVLQGHIESYLSGETDAELAATQLAAWKTMGESEFFRNPNTRINAAALALIGNINWTNMPIAVRNEMRTQLVPALKGIMNVLPNGITGSADDATDSAPATVSSVRSLLRTVGLMSDPLINYGDSPEAKASARNVLTRVARDLGESPDRVSIPHKKEVAHFLGTAEGIRALNQFAADNPEMYDNLRSGMQSYYQQTAHAFARRLAAHMDLKQPVLFELWDRYFTAFGNVGESVLDREKTLEFADYRLEEDGTVRFFINGAGTPEQRERVRRLNAEFGGTIRDQVRAYAHMINGNEDYTAAWNDLLSNRGFGLASSRPEPAQETSAPRTANRLEPGSYQDEQGNFFRVTENGDIEPIDIGFPVAGVVDRE